MAALRAASVAAVEVREYVQGDAEAAPECPTPHLDRTARVHLCTLGNAAISDQRARRMQLH